MDPKEVATSLVMPSSKPGPAGGPVLDWSGTGTCGPSSFLASSRAGPHNRWQGAWLVRLASPSSHMRASTASSTPSWLERRTTLGVTICPGPRPNGAGVAVREAVPPPSSPSAVPWRNALQRPRTVDVQAIGRQISCSSAPTVKLSSLSMNAIPDSSWRFVRPVKLLAPTPTPSPASWDLCPSPGARLSPSTTAPSSLATMTSIPWLSRLSSAIPILPGRKAESRMPSAVCADPFLERLTWLPCPMTISPPCSRLTTIPHVSAWTIKPPPRYSGTTCCTSNVNPPSGLRRNDCGCMMSPSTGLGRTRHSGHGESFLPGRRESEEPRVRNDAVWGGCWIPAFAGMTVGVWWANRHRLRACEEIGMVIGHKRGEVGE